MIENSGYTGGFVGITRYSNAHNFHSSVNDNQAIEFYFNNETQYKNTVSQNNITGNIIRANEIGIGLSYSQSSLVNFVPTGIFRGVPNK